MDATQQTKENIMKYLMNPSTGSVDTADNWEAEGYTQENSDLVEVVKDSKGDWVES